MEWFLICSFIAVVVVSSFYIANENRKTKKKIEAKEAIIKQQLISDTPVDYTPTKAIDVFVSANFLTKEWRPEFYDNCRTYSFNEIAGFELLENGEVISTTTTKTKGGITRAVVGGMVGGGVGAIVGATTANKHSNTVEQRVVTSRLVRISLTNPNVNQIEINIPKHSEYYVITKDGKYTVSFDAIGKEIISLLESMVAVAQKDDQCQKTSVDNDYVSKQLREYKQLYDDGVITEQDFNAKKKQLLGL